MTKEEKKWGLYCHLSAMAGAIIPGGNILGPLLVWLFKKDESDFINEQGLEALNFQISFTILFMIAGLLLFFWVVRPVLIIFVVVNVFFVIKASLRAKEGIHYHYPINFKLVK
jgi:hypothetical protein